LSLCSEQKIHECLAGLTAGAAHRHFCPPQKPKRTSVSVFFKAIIRERLTLCAIAAVFVKSLEWSTSC
jgi:hypothetical protein